jgi:hypothetical protein
MKCKAPISICRQAIADKDELWMRYFGHLSVDHLQVSLPNGLAKNYRHDERHESQDNATDSNKPETAGLII